MQFIVSIYVRNASTDLMKDMSYGKDYSYAHDKSDDFIMGGTYFPDESGEFQL